MEQAQKTFPSTVEEALRNPPTLEEVLNEARRASAMKELSPALQAVVDALINLERSMRQSQALPLPDFPLEADPDGDDDATIPRAKFTEQNYPGLPR